MTRQTEKKTHHLQQLLHLHRVVTHSPQLFLLLPFNLRTHEGIVPGL
jgi:hypothetical protein